MPVAEPFFAPNEPVPDLQSPAGRAPVVQAVRSAWPAAGSEPSSRYCHVVVPEEINGASSAEAAGTEPIIVVAAIAARAAVAAPTVRAVRRRRAGCCEVMVSLSS